MTGLIIQTGQSCQEGVKIVDYNVGEKIDITCTLIGLSDGDPVRIEGVDKLFKIIGTSSNSITITPIDYGAVPDAKIISSIKNQYKEFYQKKMRQRR